LAEEGDICKESMLPIKLLIKRKDFRIYAEGTVSAIYKELDSLACFADKVAEKLEIGEESLAIGHEPEVSPEEIEKISTADIPSIKSSKRTIENLESLFNTSWGKTPRTLAEIMKALEVNAIPDRMASVNVYLTRLVQRGKLRRIEKEGKYVYFKLPE